MSDVHRAMSNVLVSITQWPNPGKKQAIGSFSHRNKYIGHRTMDIGHLTTAGDQVRDVIVHSFALFAIVATTVSRTPFRKCCRRSGPAGRNQTPCRYPSLGRAL